MIEYIFNLSGDKLNLVTSADRMVDTIKSAIPSIAKKGIDQAYNDTPFKHVTGNYYSKIRYEQESDDLYVVTATAHYSSYLETGQRSFKGYYIFHRAADHIESWLNSTIRSLVGSYGLI